jgi:hypothetical protein
MRQTRTATIERARPPTVPSGEPAGAVTRAELDAEAAELLPRRDTLCQIGCVNVTTIVGVNLAFAINAATANSTANAFAAQYLIAFR